MASYHPLFLSSAHTEVQVEYMLEIAERVMSRMK
jgi:glutamate-1-semialdehyde aminotransferase